MNRSHYLLQELGSQLLCHSRAKLYPGRILIVDGKGNHYDKILASNLPECQFICEVNPEIARRIFLSSPIDLVIMNHSPSLSCLKLLPAFKLARPSVSVIVVTNCGSEELAVQVFRQGAIDYFRMPVDINSLELAIRAVLEFQRTRKEKKSPQALSGIQRAILYIKANYTNPLSLSRVAREASMSISCFERHLKKQTGMTFTEFVNAQRVAKAKEMIRKENFSMMQIALVCGFGNQSHFNRVFRKVAGTTPRGYRKIDCCLN
ncbi:MAG: helix-turn-helix domain-containing protein [Geobacteraceae bacterium]|nr:helix-turn-helix domain-containing protein [Geobacteraceae bacterium]